MGDRHGRGTAALRNLGLGDYLLPVSNTPADLPADWTTQMLVATDGSPDTIDAVKSVMAASTGVVPYTVEDQDRKASTDQRLARLLLLSYLLAIALIAVVSLAVAAADDLRWDELVLPPAIAPRGMPSLRARSPRGAVANHSAGGVS